jgi:two-component SAPR family response regulator
MIVGLLAMMLTAGSIHAQSAGGVHAQEREYGLGFKSYEVEKEKRTSLNLTPYELMSLPDKYSLAFELRFDSHGRDPFGYVFRMFDRQNRSINLLLTLGNGQPEHFLSFTFGTTEILRTNFDELRIDFDQWFNIKVEVDTEGGLMAIEMADTCFHITVEALDGFERMGLIFGKNERSGLQQTDIPSISIRNIRIADAVRRKTLYHWRMENYTPEGVYDEVRKALATVDNPLWLINRHVFWEKTAEILTGKIHNIAYNPELGEVAVFDNQRFIHHNIIRTQTKVEQLPGFPVWGAQSNNMLYDHSSGRYIYYTFEFEQAGKVMHYDPATGWDDVLTRVPSPDYWHHNRFISARDGRMYLFGGYGHHKYRNIVNVCDLASDTWTELQLSGDVPYPFYLAGMGVIDESRLLLFGGYGSKMGLQSIAPQFYYDLYLIDLEQLSSQRLWSMKPPKEDFAVSNTMVVDTAARTFYALTYPVHQFQSRLTLRRFSMDNPVCEELGDNISLNFGDTKSYIELHADKQLQSLTAIVSEPVEDASGQTTRTETENNTVSIYRLAFPPHSKADLYQAPPLSKLWLWSVSGLGVIIIILILLRRSIGRLILRLIAGRRTAAGASSPEDLEYLEDLKILRALRALKESARLEGRDDPDVLKALSSLEGWEALKSSSSVEAMEALKDSSETSSEAAIYEFRKPKVAAELRKQSILLFGGFCVIDRDGNDITKDFTPMLKQLFLMILLYTNRDRKGLSSRRLKDTLWFDKSEESAKNNRGVSMSKLRQIFESVGDVRIIHNSSYWTVEFGEDVYCDYTEALRFFDSVSHDSSYGTDELRQALTALSRGELLPNLQVEWVDSFKADFSNRLLDVLLALSQKEPALSDPLFCIDLADAIFIHDSLNENALSLKCTSLAKIGRNKLSQKVYESFAKEYRHLFDEEFAVPFEKIVRK